MSAKFCNVLCYKCSWYFMATLNHLILFVCSVYWFHAHFHVRMLLHHLGVSLPHNNSFDNVKNYYFKNGYYIICDGYGVNGIENWMNGDRFHTPSYELFSDGRKAPKRSFSGNLAGWIIT